jgi:hypothetical protein
MVPGSLTDVGSPSLSDTVWQPLAGSEVPADGGYLTGWEYISLVPFLP